jgi:hypothetical protein
MLEQTIHELASRQYGLFSRSQVLDARGYDQLIVRRLASGAWLSEGIGVYGLPGWPSSWMRDVWREHLAAGSHSAASGEAGASLHELHPFPKFGSIEMSVPHGDHHRGAAVVRQPRDLVEAHITVVRGMRVTTIARTFCDLASRGRRERLTRAIEQAHLDRKCSIAELDALYQHLRRPGKRGFGLLNSILEVRRDDFVVPEGDLERMFRRLLRREAIPEPVWQAPLPWDARRRADGLWPHVNALLELDSRSWHARIDQMKADRKRDRDARRNGYGLYRFTYEEVKYEGQSVANELRDILHLAA